MIARSIATLLVVALAACSDDARPPAPAATQTPTKAGPTKNEPPAPPAPEYGILEGTITILEGAEVPSLPVAMIPRRGEMDIPESCPPPRRDDRQLIRIASDGHGLNGVIVTVADFEAHNNPPHTPRTHDLTIRECRLEPRMIDATVGDTLRLHNDDEYPFMPSTTGGGMTQALIKGQTRDIPLARGGSQMLGCGAFGPPCGRADVLVLNHAVHGLTSQNGHYRIEHVPAGEEITVHAVGLMYRTEHQAITLQPGETRTVDFVLTPTPFAEPVPNAPPTPGAPTMF